MDLRFECGKIAGARGWDSAVVVDSSRLMEEAPSSIPLLVEATRDQVTIDVARIVSALHAAGRPVVIVTDSAPPTGIAQWIPNECLHLIGTPVAGRSVEPVVDAVSDGTDEFFGGYPPDIEVPLEQYVSGLEADELLTLAGWLETTSITFDTNREWWMKLYCLHHLGGGWDRAGHRDIMEHVGLVAFPLRIGKSLVLGVGDVGGEEGQEGCYVITGSWDREDSDPRRGEVYTNGWREVDAVSVGILLTDRSNSQAQATPDPLPQSVRSTFRGEEVVLQLIESALLEITWGLLKYGAHGFQRAKPQLQVRLDDFRVAAAQYLRSCA